MRNELCARRAVLCTQQALTCCCTDHPAILRLAGVDSASADAGTPHHVPRANCKALCVCLSLPSLMSGEHSAVGSNFVGWGWESRVEIRISYPASCYRLLTLELRHTFGGGQGLTHWNKSP